MARDGSITWSVGVSTSSQGRVDRGILTFGAQDDRHEATTTRSDPRCHDAQYMHSAGGGEHGRSHAYQRAPSLAPTGVALPLASRTPPNLSAPGAARSPGTLLLNKELHQRLTQARSEGNLLRLHAEHSGSFNEVKLATCWSRLGRVDCVEGLREQTLATLGEWGARELGNLAHPL